ncbi:hypothetical protein ACFGVR_14235 [Mucilaginibacter sp. AW1-3]
MKKTLLIIVCLLTVQGLQAQKFEFSAHLNSGLFYYAGSSARDISFVWEQGEGAHTNDQYGTTPTISYGFAAQVQYVTKFNLLGGIQMGYQHLRNRVDLVPQYLLGAPPTSNSQVNNGYAIFDSQTINYNPYIGYRLTIKKVAVDIDAGLNFDKILHMHENGRTPSASGSDVTTDIERSHPSSDFGYRFELKANYLRYGITAGYDYGLSNYYSGYVGGRPEAYSRMIRFGLSYRII